jgi:UDP-glucose 4-epimerase
VNVLITGGLGQVGSYLTEELAKEKSNNITILDNFSSNIKDFKVPEGVVILKGDIRDNEVVDKLVSENEIIIHTAAQVSVVNSIENPIYDAENNIMGTLAFLNAARKSNIRRFLYISSAAVYGAPQYLPIDEKHPVNPMSPYGLSKLTGEKYAMMFHSLYGLPVVCLRPFNIYSPRQNPGSPYSGVITKFIERARAGKPPIIFGDGKQTRDFVSIYDVVSAAIKCIEIDDAVGEVFNVGTGIATTINELASLCSDMEPEYKAAISGDIRDSYSDICKAKDKVGYYSGYNLKDGLLELL